MSQIQVLTSVIDQLHEISGNSSYKYMLITQDDSHPNTELTFHYSPHFNLGQIEELKLLLGRSSLTTIKPTLINLFPLKLIKNQSPQQLLNQYRDLFNSLSQYICKDVAKAWIKILEPNKQALFPYRDYNKSKPDWWPQHVNHIEPDHLDKIGRVEVLINVLRHPRFDLRRVDLKLYQEKPILFSLLKEILYLAMYERMFYNLLRHQDELFYLIPQHERDLFDFNQIQIMTSRLKHPFKPNEVVMASKIIPREVNSRIYGLNETNEMYEENEERGRGKRRTLVVKLRHRRSGKVKKPIIGKKQTRATFKKEIAKLEKETKASQVKGRECSIDVTPVVEIKGSDTRVQDVDRFENKKVLIKMETKSTTHVESELKDEDTEHSNADSTNPVKFEEYTGSREIALENYEEAKLGSPFSYKPEEEASNDSMDDATDDEEYVDDGEEDIVYQELGSEVDNHNRRINNTNMLITPEFDSSNKFDVKRLPRNSKSAGDCQYPITPASSSNNIQNMTFSLRTRLKHMKTSDIQQQDGEDVATADQKPTNVTTHTEFAHYSTPYNNIVTQVNCPSTPHPNFTLSTGHIKQDFLDFNQLPMPNDEFENNVMGIMNQIGTNTSCQDIDGCDGGGFESDLTDYVSDHSSCDGSFVEKSDDTDYDIIDQCELKSEHDNQEDDYNGSYVAGNGEVSIPCCLNI